MAQSLEGAIKLSEYSLTKLSVTFSIDITHIQRVNGVKTKVSESDVDVYQKFYNFYIPCYMKEEDV